jgi:DNA repair ATPase RecN
VSKLNQQQQVDEIAVMVGDGEVSAASRQTALELLAHDSNEDKDSQHE